MGVFILAVRKIGGGREARACTAEIGVGGKRVRAPEIACGKGKTGITKCGT